MKRAFATCMTAGIAAALSFGTSSITVAQTYPSKPVRILSAFGPGNPADTALRLVTQKMGESMGQPILVEPQTVASGVGAAQIVMRAPADGYTLLYVLPSMLMIPPYLIKNKPFDPLKDFVPISGLGTFDFLFAVRTDSKFKTLEDLIKLAKQKPGALNVGTINVGSTQNLAAELFEIHTILHE